MGYSLSGRHQEKAHKKVANLELLLDVLLVWQYMYSGKVENITKNMYALSIT